LRLVQKKENIFCQVGTRRFTDKVPYQRGKNARDFRRGLRRRKKRSKGGRDEDENASQPPEVK